MSETSHEHAHDHMKQAMNWFIKMRDAIVAGTTLDLTQLHQQELTSRDLAHQEELTQLRKEFQSATPKPEPANLSLLQSLSKTISEQTRELDSANAQIKSLKKLLTEAQNRKTTLDDVPPSIKIPTPPPTPKTEAKIPTPTPPPTEIKPVQVQPQPQPQVQITTHSCSKIKFKEKYYYLLKNANSQGDFMIYECLVGNQVGLVVGKKTADGKYQFNT